jgi:hypothetical protein
VPPRKKTTPRPPALTSDDVAGLRAQVTAGEKPRVIVRAASAAVPAGTRGNVIRMGPPSEGEFIVVRLGRDEVPFAPAELSLSARGKSAAAAAKTTSGRTTATRTTTVKSTPAKSTPAKSSPAGRRAAAKSARSRPAAAPATTKAAATPPAAKKTATTRRTGKRTSRRGQHPLTVTVRFVDGKWTVEGHRGSRRLAKASPLRPGAVKAFAELVDEPAIRDAVTDIVESGRAVVEERATKLRAELQAAEAALKEYEARRR